MEQKRSSLHKAPHTGVHLKEFFCSPYLLKFVNSTDQSGLERMCKKQACCTRHDFKNASFYSLTIDGTFVKLSGNKNSWYALLVNLYTKVKS